MATPGPANPETVSVKVKTLINSQLKQILKKEGLLVSGAKATLQSRIIDRLHQYARHNDIEGFNRLRSLVYNPDADLSNLSPSPSTNQVYQNHPPLPPVKLHPPSFYNNPLRSGVSVAAPPISGHGSGSRAPQFKSSPFYSVLEPLTSVLECKVRETTRDTVEATINLRAKIAESLSSDPNVRVMIYCAADAMSPFSRVDIEFPHQIEIKVNQDEVKANLRGLKNKPGTTRPADITYMLRHKAGYNNHMVVIYALTKKRYFMIVNLVRRHPVEELVTKLKAGKTITKEQVLREMISRAEDADIVATSTIMSLKCPLSTLRIEIPCRSSICSHNQCFDANSFLQLQEQAPTWTCPVCNKAVGFDYLHVDQYVNDILKSTPRTVDQITIEPNGRWSQTSASDPTPPRTSNGHASSSDDGDLVEISDMPRIAAVKQVAPHDSRFMSTPPVLSREQSQFSAIPPVSNNKRSAGQVVDLTLSSDEDEDPPRSAKRQASNRSFSGLPRFSELGNLSLRPNGNANGVLEEQHASNPFGHPPQMA